MGSGGKVNGCSEAVATAFNNMRQIVTVGWSIYPLGYFFGYLLNSVDETFLNVIYNIADFVNKIAFVLSCWSCAKSDSEGKKDALLGYLGSCEGKEILQAGGMSLSQRNTAWSRSEPVLVTFCINKAEAIASQPF